MPHEQLFVHFVVEPFAPCMGIAPSGQLIEAPGKQILGATATPNGFDDAMLDQAPQLRLECNGALALRGE